MKNNLVAKLLVIAIGFMASFVSEANQEYVNGYSWEFYVDEEDGVHIYGAYPEPTGHLTIPSSLDGYPVRHIGGWAFEGCDRMTGVTIPNGVESIGSYAFEDCSALKELTVPGSVKYLGNRAFYDCEKLEKVVIEEGVEQVGSFDDCPFEGCNNLREAYFPSTVASISHPFIDCDNLKTVSFAPDSRFVSDNGVIRSKNWDEIVCVWGVSSSKLTVFDIPQTVKKIGNLAFFCCEKLKAIHIPSSVEEFGMNPFVCCYSIEAITLDSENQSYKIENGLLLTKDGRKLIATAGSYKAKRRDIVVPEGVEDVGILSLTSDMVDIRNVWLPVSLSKMTDALEWGGNGGKNGEYGVMEHVVFMTQNRFEVEEGACLFCDCDIDNVWFAGPVPKNFYSEEWWECGNVRKIHYTPEYKNEWESALRKIGYAGRGVVNALHEFPSPPAPPVNESEGIRAVPSDASVYNGSLSQGDKVAGTIQA
ncbi:MAG: leucine-rich repeat domain-containing protein, partial [Kiritimatiellae bacterium]|nr:leucine-rich repeat domain-containing protein [Kiritimatiellia bacterium]